MELPPKPWALRREPWKKRDVYKRQEIAYHLGTTQQVYSRYEKGINEMPIRYVIALSQFYHVSADYILGLTDVKTPYPPKTKRK